MSIPVDSNLSLEPVPEPKGLGPIGLEAAAVGVGLVAGLAELGWVVLRPALGLPVAIDALRINRFVAWMAPLSDAVLFGIAGLVPALIALRWPKLGRKVAAVMLGGLFAWALIERVPATLHWAARLALVAGLGTQLARLAGKHPMATARAVRFGVPALVAAMAVLGPIVHFREVGREARSLAALPPADPSSPDVYLIVLDTVRADHLSAFGYDRDTSPNLARWADRGVRFENASSTAPWTLPSHASLFTGMWPHEPRRRRVPRDGPVAPDPRRGPGLARLRHGRVRGELVLLQRGVRRRPRVRSLRRLL